MVQKMISFNIYTDDHVWLALLKGNAYTFWENWNIKAKAKTKQKNKNQS